MTKCWPRLPVDAPNNAATSQACARWAKGQGRRAAAYRRCAGRAPTAGSRNAAASPSASACQPRCRRLTLNLERRAAVLADRAARELGKRNDAEAADMARSLFPSVSGSNNASASLTRNRAKAASPLMPTKNASSPTIVATGRPGFRPLPASWKANPSESVAAIKSAPPALKRWALSAGRCQAKAMAAKSFDPQGSTQVLARPGPARRPGGIGPGAVQSPARLEQTHRPGFAGPASRAGAAVHAARRWRAAADRLPALPVKCSAGRRRTWPGGTRRTAAA